VFDGNGKGSHPPRGTKTSGRKPPEKSRW
jgi:hypothetical protein